MSLSLKNKYVRTLDLSSLPSWKLGSVIFIPRSIMEYLINSNIQPYICIKHSLKSKSVIAVKPIKDTRNRLGRTKNKLVFQFILKQ